MENVNEKRPISIVLTAALIGLFSMASLRVVFSRFANLLYVSQSALIVSAFICLLIAKRAHVTYYLATTSLALLVIKGARLSMAPDIDIPPLPPNSFFPRLASATMTFGTATLFWRHAFGKPSRRFYGVRK
jgi:hypothetical protein